MSKLFKIITVDCCRARAVEDVREVKVSDGITGRDLCISGLTDIQLTFKKGREEEGDEEEGYEFYNTFGWTEDGKEWWYEHGEDTMFIIIGEGHEWWDKFGDLDNWGDKEQEEFEEWEGRVEATYTNQEFEIV